MSIIPHHVGDIFDDVEDSSLPYEDRSLPYECIVYECMHGCDLPASRMHVYAEPFLLCIIFNYTFHSKNTHVRGMFFF